MRDHLIRRVVFIEDVNDPSGHSDREDRRTWMQESRINRNHLGPEVPDEFQTTNVLVPVEHGIHEARGVRLFGVQNDSGALLRHRSTKREFVSWRQVLLVLGRLYPRSVPSSRAFVRSVQFPIEPPGTLRVPSEVEAIGFGWDTRIADAD